MRAFRPILPSSGTHVRTFKVQNSHRTVGSTRFATSNRRTNHLCTNPLTRTIFSLRGSTLHSRRGYHVLQPVTTPIKLKDEFILNEIKDADDNLQKGLNITHIN
jgi:hypothetical protein